MKISASDVDPSYRIEDAWKEFFEPVLRSAGFKGSGRNFRRVQDNFAQCVSLQSSGGTGRFAVNLGVHPMAVSDTIFRLVDPKKVCEIACEFRRRLADGTSDQWWSYTQLKSSKIAAVLEASGVMVEHGLPSLEYLGSADSPLSRIDPHSFGADIFDFRGFTSTKARMARALSLMRRDSGDLAASKAFARIALANLGKGVGLKSELEDLAG